MHPQFMTQPNHNPNNIHGQYVKIIENMVCEINPLGSNVVWLILGHTTSPEENHNHRDRENNKEDKNRINPSIVVIS